MTSQPDSPTPMDINALKTVDLRFWHLSRYAAAVCFAVAGAIMLWSMPGPALAEARLLLVAMHVY